MNVRERLHELAETLPENAIHRLLDYASELPQPFNIREIESEKANLDEEEKKKRRRDNFRRLAGSIQLGYSCGDNESIDADLADEYANPHRPEP